MKNPTGDSSLGAHFFSQSIKFFKPLSCSIDDFMHHYVVVGLTTIDAQEVICRHPSWVAGNPWNGATRDVSFFFFFFFLSLFLVK